MSESSPDPESAPQPSNCIVMLEGDNDLLNSPPQVSADFSVHNSWIKVHDVLFCSYIMVGYVTFTPSLDTSESDSDSEVWDRNESDTSDAPEDLDFKETSESWREKILAQWILRLLMAMQALKFPTLLLNFLYFFAVVFSNIGTASQIAKGISACLPKSIYMASKMVGLVRFERYVVYKKCMSLYTFADGIKLSGTAPKSKVCSFCRFPTTLLKVCDCHVVEVPVPFSNVLLPWCRHSTTDNVRETQFLLCV